MAVVTRSPAPRRRPRARRDDDATTMASRSSPTHGGAPAPHRRRPFGARTSSTRSARGLERERRCRRRTAATRRRIAVERELVGDAAAREHGSTGCSAAQAEAARAARSGACPSSSLGTSVAPVDRALVRRRAARPRRRARPPSRSRARTVDRLARRRRRRAPSRPGASARHGTDGRRRDGLGHEDHDDRPSRSRASRRSPGRRPA